MDVGSEVWVTNSDNKGESIRGVVSSQAETPRSYIVHTPSGQLKRNSRHLAPVPEDLLKDSTRETINRGWATFKVIRAYIIDYGSVTFSSQSYNDTTEIRY